MVGTFQIYQQNENWLLSMITGGKGTRRNHLIEAGTMEGLSNCWNGNNY